MRLLEVEEGEHERLSALGDAFDATLGSLWMAFQPIVTADGAPFGFEALMRSDDARLPNPLAVLDAAERLHRLPDLGSITRARAVAAFVANAPPETCLFVNLHPRDLLDDSLLDARGPLASIAGRVVLEITERTSLEGLRDLRSRLSQFRALGFRLAVDDLGAGYAGLTSFASLEPEFVKIDMSLVRDVHLSVTKRRLVAMIATVSHEMGTAVVAEGIECAAERDVVVELGCTLLQGYHLGRPARTFPGQVPLCTWPTSCTREAP
jgi:EAL domain-containing protein (putative c-di-GMP-specific phosphodiesterase class I)